MSRTDVMSTWQGSIAFNVTTTPRRLRFVKKRDAGDGNRWLATDYLEVDARGVKSGPLYYALGGSTATATLATGALEGTQPNFRLPPDSIDRLFVHATSISVISTAATQIYINWGRY